MLDDISRHRLLTHEEEIALAERIQAGDQDALDDLVSHNMRLVHSIARRYYADDPAATYDDLVAEGLLGLLIAAHRYDPGRGTRFSTYAHHWVRQRIQRFTLTSGPIRRSANPYEPRIRAAHIRAHALRQMPVARLDAPLPGRNREGSLNTLADIISDGSESVEDQVLSSIETERIIAALQLNPRGQAIVRDWLSGVPRREAQRLHGVSHSWLDTTLKKRNMEKIMPDQPAPTCIEPGCDQPRYVNTKGTTLSRCHEHQKQFWRESQRAKDAAARKRTAPATAVQEGLKPLPTPAHVSEVDRTFHELERESNYPLPPQQPPTNGQHQQAQQTEGCTCPDCIYRELVSHLAARDPRIAELAEAMLAARRLRDELGI